MHCHFSCFILTSSSNLCIAEHNNSCKVSSFFNKNHPPPVVILSSFASHQRNNELSSASLFGIYLVFFSMMRKHKLEVIDTTSSIKKKTTRSSCRIEKPKGSQNPEQNYKIDLATWIYCTPSSRDAIVIEEWILLLSLQHMMFEYKTTLIYYMTYFEDHYYKKINRDL